MATEPHEIKTRSFKRFASEYGARAISAARIACRSERTYPLEAPWSTRATPLGGKGGLLAELVELG